MRGDRVVDLLNIGANLAVLCGLVFVGLQVRDSRAAAEAQVAESVAAGFQELTSAGMSDPAVACIWVVGLFRPEDLHPIELTRFAFFMRGVFNQYERVFRQYETGLVNRVQWEMIADEIGGVMATPGGRLFLADNPYPEDFLSSVPTSGTPLAESSWTLGAELPKTCP